MSHGIGQRPDPHSPRAMAWIVAAILLVLHWAAPLAVASAPADPLDNSRLEFSGDARTAQRGLAPRSLTRVAGCEATTLKASESAWIADDAPAALAPQGPTTAPHFGGTAHACAVAPAPFAASRRAFQARAPPFAG